MKTYQQFITEAGSVAKKQCKLVTSALKREGIGFDVTEHTGYMEVSLKDGTIVCDGVGVALKKDNKELYYATNLQRELDKILDLIV